MDLFIYNEIGWEVTAERIQKELSTVKDDEDVLVHISSPGGGVFEGWAIGNIIKALPNKTTAKIEGLCASIATYIALSCDSVEMSETARFMIHNPSTFVEGEKEALETAAEQLDSIKTDLIKIYKNKTGIADDELSVMMDEQTWLTADEALEKGFIDSITEPAKAVARLDFNFKKMSKETDETKEKISALDGIIEKAGNLFARLTKFAPENITVELADGGLIFVESEDGELVGKMAFVADEEGNATETPAPDGSHALIDGRTLVVEAGVVTAVEEASDEVEDLKNKITELEAELKVTSDAKEAVENEIKETQSDVKNLMTEVQNLKTLTVGGSAVIEKPVKVIEKIVTEEEPSKEEGLKMWAKEYIANNH